MNAKKKDGDIGEPEPINIQGQAAAGAVAADEPPADEKAAALAPKAPEPVRKPDVAAKADGKVQPKPKKDVEPQMAAKPAETKSLAEIMKLDMRGRKRRRF